MDGVNSSYAVVANSSYSIHSNSSDQTALAESEDIESDFQESSIIAFINKLTFKVDDANKEDFFDELETILASCDEEEIEDSAALYKFFAKHAL